LTSLVKKERTKLTFVKFEFSNNGKEFPETGLKLNFTSSLSVLD